jgi:exosortase A
MTDLNPKSLPGGPVGVSMLIFLFASFLAVYYPVLSGLYKVWDSSDDYSHGFLIIPVSLYILWQNRTTLSAQKIEGNWFGLLLAVFALFMFLFGKFGAIFTLSSVSMVVFIWGAVIFLLGFKTFQICSFPLVFLLFMIPVPAQIYAALTSPLQFIVTKVTVGMASMMGIAIYREGNVIHLADMVFEVVQACSGLRSIMTMLTLGAIFGYFSLRSMPLRLILMTAGIPIAIAINIFRVFSMVVSYNYFKLDLTQGTPHTVLGLLVFVLGFVLFLVLQKGLAKCEK